MAASPKPLHHRRAETVAPAAAADKVSIHTENAAVVLARYKVLTARAVEVFGDEIKAAQWLSTPSVDFGGKAPIQVASQSGYEAEVLEPVFTRIEHGIYF